tara:strand:+ start:3238 stop:3471 length:234 start_codon:yes stop_codon:yes gene_type:complete
MKIEIGPEMEDKIIVKGLVECIYSLSKSSNDVYETPANKVRDISALLTTLNYFTSEREFKELTKNLKIKLNPSKREQ